MHDSKFFKDQLFHYDQEGLQLDLPSFDDHETSKTIKIIDQQSQRRVGKRIWIEGIEFRWEGFL